jgi:hypothetical protein
MADKRNNMMNPRIQQTPAARFERKFLVADMTRAEIEAIVKLHPAMFQEAYPCRYVNNLYLDSYAATSYFATIDGLSERCKFRIRWYGELFGRIEKPVLELKTKSGSIGSKASYPLPPLNLDGTFSPADLSQLFLASELPDDLKWYVRSLRVWLLIRYQRRYFQSVDRRYRLTMDWELEYYRVPCSGNGLHVKSVDTASTIVEFKYGCEDEDGADMISRYFPFRMTKNSKYVNGIDRLFC